MKPHQMNLHVEGCGNLKHGPFASCWKVVDERGSRVIQGVPKDVADLYAAAPEMARALIGLLERPDGCPMCDEGVLRKGSDKHWPECPYPAARAALQKAGVL